MFDLERYKKYDITPVPAPRQSRRDTWNPRPCVVRYRDFRDQVRDAEITLPNEEYHVVFVIPVRKSWSKKKQKEMLGQPFQVKPDKDNLEKALLDSLFKEDCQVWDGRVSKIWGEQGAIYIGSIADSIRRL